MAELITLQNFMDYSGVIVGLVLLIAAVAVLPGRLRWYVLTAGLAVIAFRTFQIWNNKKRLKEADAKREELRGVLDDLGERRKNLEKDLLTLNGELDEIKNQKNQLAEKSAGLAASGAALGTEKTKLDEQMQALDEKDQQLMNKIQARDAAIQQYEEAKRASKELGKSSELSSLSPSELARRASSLD